MNGARTSKCRTRGREENKGVKKTLRVKHTKRNKRMKRGRIIQGGPRLPTPEEKKGARTGLTKIILPLPGKKGGELAKIKVPRKKPAPGRGNSRKPWGGEKKKKRKWEESGGVKKEGNKDAVSKTTTSKALNNCRRRKEP